MRAIMLLGINRGFDNSDSLTARRDLGFCIPRRTFRTGAGESKGQPAVADVTRREPRRTTSHAAGRTAWSDCGYR